MKKVFVQTIQIFSLDVENMKNIDKNISVLFKKFGCPDVLINCSYPITKNWVKVHSKKINYRFLEKISISI